MIKVLRFLETYQQASHPVPCLTVGVFCLVITGVPIAGSANWYGSASEFAPDVASGVASEVGSQVGIQMHFLPVESAIPNETLARPTSLVKDEGLLQLLKQQVRLPKFVESSAVRDAAALAENVVADADPRLQRNGRTWDLSHAFNAKVGADPWALLGVGFPNVETHKENLGNNYKPYRAVVDWQRVNASGGEVGEWAPVPAVYCMGLSAQEIAARAAKHEREILSYAMEYGISASLVKAVITKESCFDTTAVSKVGAEGLMQLMPETARWLKVTDRKDVSQNLSAGIRYLSDLQKRFGTEELALAAYNAGPGNVERHGGIPPFEETQQYVKSVMAFYKRYTVTSRFANQRASN